MKQISVSVPETILEYIESLVKLKLYPNRNEVIRVALKEFISKESLFIQNLNIDHVKLQNIQKKYIEFKEEFFKNLY